MSRKLVRRIALEPVESSNVEQVGYDETLEQLYVGFKGGGDALYVYSQVPRKKFDDLMTADSVGSFLAKHIKGEHPFAKLPVIDADDEGVAEALHTLDSLEAIIEKR